MAFGAMNGFWRLYKCVYAFRFVAAKFGLRRGWGGTVGGG
jgi:hypothetical protein